jgi:hypothetical protein
MHSCGNSRQDRGELSGNGLFGAINERPHCIERTCLCSPLAVLYDTLKRFEN